MSLKKNMKASVRVRSRVASSLRSFSEATSANMKVCLRIRPPNEAETRAGRRIIVEPIDSRMLVFDPKEELEPFGYGAPVSAPSSHNYLKKPNKELQFMFNAVFGCDATNAQVFDVCTKDLVASLMEGYNCSVFAYGATGAGKTHTMLGRADSPGVVYLTVQELFDSIERQRHEREFETCVSYLEIYNENVHDLLRPSGPLYIRDDGKFGAQIAGLHVAPIKTAQELLDMLDKGSQNRTQHPTDANAESSRSHAVFQVYVRMRTKATNQFKIVKLSMIDLAGSERASATGCKGERFKEGANINRSLLALGNCINQLADGSKFIPYRDSKLTRLLKDSLGGNCRTVMIANVAPTGISYEDTYNTLKYATRATKIQQRTKKNIINCDGHVTQYVRQIEELKDRVKRLETELMEKENMVVIPDSRSENVSEEVLKKWSTELKSQAEIHFSRLHRVLVTQRKQRSLAARAMRKLRTVAVLSTLSSETRNSPNHIVSDDVSRMQLSFDNLMKQINAMQTELSTSVRELENSQNNLKQLRVEAFDACPLTESLISSLNYRESLIIAEAKVDHFKTLLLSQRDETNGLNSVAKNSFYVLRKYLLRLKSQGILTSTMLDEYNNLVKEAKNSKIVTWVDEQSPTESGDEFFEFILNLHGKYDDVPAVPDMNLKDDVMDMDENTAVNDDRSDSVNAGRLLNVTFDGNDVNMGGDCISDAIMALKADVPKYKPNIINADVLNSTFSLTERPERPGKRVHKTIEVKKILSERTNVFDARKLLAQKSNVSNEKIKVFKHPHASINKENKTTFVSSVKNAQNVQSSKNKMNTQVGFKIVRNKERSALASVNSPYHKSGNKIFKHK